MFHSYAAIRCRFSLRTYFVTPTLWLGIKNSLELSLPKTIALMARALWTLRQHLVAVKGCLLLLPAWYLNVDSCEC